MLILVILVIYFMVFEKKKIHLETLSEYLLEVRKQLNLTLSQVVQKTSIKETYLEDLENGKFYRLPPDVYVLGFLRQLGGLYSVDSEVLIKQYKKEKGILRQLQQRQGERSSWRKRYFKNFVITPKLLSLATGSIFVVVTILYIVWQVLSINRTPSLEILQPQDNEAIKETSVNIVGRTDPGMTVTVNGQNIFVDDKGAFQTKLGLQSGPTQLNIVASNRFGKSASESISVIQQDIAQQPDPLLASRSV